VLGISSTKFIPKTFPASDSEKHTDCVLSSVLIVSPPPDVGACAQPSLVGLLVFDVEPQCLGRLVH
jgi:hypothetical protein